MSPAGRRACRAIVIILAGALAACSRTPSGSGPGSGSPAPAAPPAPPARTAEPFTHPLLAAAADRVRHEDCSREGLSTVTEQIRLAATQAMPPRARAKNKARSALGACRSPAIEELGRSVRQEMLGRVGACVAQDGPLDPEWDMASSSALALSECLDCARAADEQAARCRRALDVVRRIERPASAAGTPR